MLKYVLDWWETTLIENLHSEGSKTRNLIKAFNYAIRDDYREIDSILYWNKKNSRKIKVDVEFLKLVDRKKVFKKYEELEKIIYNYTEKEKQEIDKNWAYMATIGDAEFSSPALEVTREHRKSEYGYKKYI